MVYQIYEYTVYNKLDNYIADDDIIFDKLKRRAGDIFLFFLNCLLGNVYKAEHK